MLAPKPFTIHPFDEMVQFKVPWLEEFIKLVNDTIQNFNTAIEIEAQTDGEPKLASETFLYERFLDNKRLNLWNGNWQVLKYFYQLFRKKIVYDMIGQWKFTEYDVEMYNYFLTTNFPDASKCKPAHLKFNVKPELLLDPRQTSTDKYSVFVFHYDWWYQFPKGDHSNRADHNYPSLFGQEFHTAELMLRNAKKLTQYNWPEPNFFCAKKFHPDYEQGGSQAHDYTELPNRGYDFA